MHIVISMVAYQAPLKKNMILPGGSDLLSSHVGMSAHVHYIHRNKGCVCKSQVHKINGYYSIASWFYSFFFILVANKKLAL